jgi:hypothetical protein
LLGLVLGYLFSFDDQPLYPLIALAVLGAALGAPLFAVALLALLNSSVGGRVIPAGTDPADVRAARRALRAGELSGRPEVDRIARTLASQARSQQVPPWLFAVLFTLIGVMNLSSAWSRYGEHGGWHWTAVLSLVLGSLILVGAAVVAPLDARYRRRTRAFAAACDAEYGPLSRRGDGDGPTR